MPAMLPANEPENPYNEVGYSYYPDGGISYSFLDELNKELLEIEQIKAEDLQRAREDFWEKQQTTESEYRRELVRIDEQYTTSLYYFHRRKMDWIAPPNEKRKNGDHLECGGFPCDCGEDD